MYGLTLRRFREDIDIPFRILRKIFRYLVYWDKLELGIEHIVRLGYVVHYRSVFIVIGYIDIDFIQCEHTIVKVVEFGSFFLDLPFQVVHCLSFIDSDREWGISALGDT